MALIVPYLPLNPLLPRPKGKFLAIREDERRFHEICESLSRECESLASFIEEEFGEDDPTGVNPAEGRGGGQSGGDS